MANTTQKPDQEDFNPARNTGQDEFDKIIDKNFSPGDEKTMEDRAASGSASDLAEQENEASQNDEASETSDIERRESNGDTSWKNNTSREPAAKKGGVGNFVGTKKKGIIGTVLGLLAIIGIISSLLSGAWGLVNFKETLVQKLGQRTSHAMEKREARVLAKKFSKDFTSGCTIKVKCRYRGFTNREIKKFNTRAAEHGYRIEAAGRSPLNPLRKSVVIQQFDVADVDPKNPEQAPKKIIRTIQPENFKSVLKTTPELRTAVKSFYKSNVEFYSGKAAKSVWSRTKTYIGKRTISEGEGDSEAKKEAFRERELIRKATSGEEQQISTQEQAGNASDPVANQEAADANSQSSEAKDIIDERASELAADREDYTKDLSEPTQNSQKYTDTYQGSVEKLKGMGTGVEGFIKPLSFALGVCTTRSLVSTANQVRSVSQVIQLIRYSLVFMTLADRIKAGEADGNVTQQINDMSSVLNSKDSSGKSGYDSMGYNWAANGVVRAGKDEDIGKYQNGGPPAGMLGGAVKSVSDMSILETLCGAAESKLVTGAFIAISIFGAGKILTTGAKTAIKAVMEKEIKKTIKDKIEDKIENTTMRTALKEVVTNPVSMFAFYMYGVPPLISTIARASTSLVTSGDERGRDGTNAAVSGFGGATSQVAKASAMRPISVDEAVDQDKLAYSEELKLAKEDGINQFDITNQYAFANKFAVSLTPSMSHFASFSSLPSALSNVMSSAVGNFGLKASAAVDESAQYKYCVDKDLEEADVAGDPFCNPQYGMSDTVLSGAAYDPEDVAEYLYNNQLITEDGEPTGDFEAFINECMQTDKPIGDTEDCLKGTKSSATASTGSWFDMMFPSASATIGPISTNPEDFKYDNMRAYCMDSGIDADMNDGAGPGCTPDVAGTAETDPGGSTDAPASVDLSTLYDPSDSISCAQGSKDLGVQTGYHDGNKLKLRLCAVQSIPETGDLSTVPGANGKLVVNSRMSAIYVKIGEDAKAAKLSDVTAGEGFRTMARQQYFYDCYKSGSCNGGNLAAQPGYSNHQAGVAVDWSQSMYNWLANGNAQKYGLKKCTCGEAWHYSPDGG